MPENLRHLREGTSGPVTMEFHVSRAARDRYGFDQTLFSLTGNVILPNFHAARVFAQKMNDKRDLLRFPESAVKAGQINAMGLIDEILHHVVVQYREQRKPGVLVEALEWLEACLGRDALDVTLARFAADFPPVAVYRGDIPLETYLAGQTGGVPHRQIVLEEMLMLWLANLNPAFAPFLELFDDSPLRAGTSYVKLFARLYEFFDTQPRFGPDNQNLIDMLRAPALASPHDLAGQLEFIRTRWTAILGRHLYRLLRGMDLIKEEEKATRFPGGPGGGGIGPGPALVYEFHGMEYEPEAFSPDLDWMPKLVLMAKNAYVWLNQLSRQYGRAIRRLDEVPDEELDALARRGFTGLWLIGVWERSPASRKIKQLMGNPEALASAYSLYDYTIAADLGGDAALQNLKDRSWRRGIRLASDMVPNHVGIFSRWVIEHPDWFIALDHSPIPSYTFNGPNLSDDPRVGIYLEDHYYTRTDAAVVFKRVDFWTGSEQYIYHGNDGTAMAWNDTAQLNYLNPEVREAVIRTIMHVAGQFPIIRFDAAMTLTKRHFQRLWFPEPGTGGDIATRSEFGMTKSQFDAAMPNEFWREVVDRAAQEAPDTLLLAEAFWLMEAYFVRSLGMHRVYNSAFMNMMRDENNANYRTLMKNTLEFDPEILKRYVNFINNPDERTAVDQFGKGDKYFGVCTVMATLPGLPMFGHGQIEGYGERYGMEFQRPMWDEQSDPDLIARHEREIVPLLHNRYLFSGVDNFFLYDFFSADGTVNEDVFAYSNRVGDERTLVIYHNRYASAAGWVRMSVAYSVKAGEDGGRALVQRTLGEGLGLHSEDVYYCIFRDQVTGLEYIRNSRQVRYEGLYVELGAYKYHVFLAFREVLDTESGQYRQLAAYLSGRGVPSIEEAVQEMLLEPIYAPYKELVNAELFRRLTEAALQSRSEAGGVGEPAGAARQEAAAPEPIAGDEPAGPGLVRGDGRPSAAADQALLDEVEEKMAHLLREIKAFTGLAGDEAPVAREVRSQLKAILRWPEVESEFALSGKPSVARQAKPRPIEGALKYLREARKEDALSWATLWGWLFTHSLGRLAGDQDPALQSRSWMDEWSLTRVLSGAFQDFGLHDGAASWAVRTVQIMTTQERWFESIQAGPDAASQVLDAWLRDGEIRQFIGVNRHRDVLWFNKEAFEQLIAWMMQVAAVTVGADAERTPAEKAEAIVAAYTVARALLRAEADSGYQVENLLAAARAGRRLA